MSPPCDPLPNDQLDPLIEDAAKRQGLKADLIRSVIRQESGQPAVRGFLERRPGPDAAHAGHRRTSSEFGIRSIPGKTSTPAPSF